jgi:predicted dehydrogenase
MNKKASNEIKTAIIGAGLIGHKRAKALPKGVRLSVICDVDEKRGLEFANKFSTQYEREWKKVVEDENIQALIICTTNNWLAPIASHAIKFGKHVLAEKPGARNIEELKIVEKAFKDNPVVVMYGYNHRYHPALLKAKDIVDSKKYGEVLFIRAKYGHGGRLGYEKEWRFQKDISGGGELLDQGAHLIDLSNYFCGEMDEVSGFTEKLFWKSELEDSAFFLLKNKKNQISQMSVSCVEWKNVFSFELMLKTAKIQIDGLGKSYGREKMILYKMKPEMGPPDMEEFLFPEEDSSWSTENKIFFERIKTRDYSPESINDAKYVLEMIKKIYNL